MRNIAPSHSFTLIEIMVAAAVLVIMMSFIFQFTNSAQRLLNTNTGRNDMSSQADTVFQLLNEDLENIYLVTPDEDLDAQAGWYCMHKDSNGNLLPFATKTGYNLSDLCFFTQVRGEEASATSSFIRPVRYHFEAATDSEHPEIGAGKLYRFEANGQNWNKLADGTFRDYGTPSNVKDKGGNPQWYYELDLDENGKLNNPKNYKDYLVAENIQTFQIISDAAVDFTTGNALTENDMPLLVTPKQFRVTIVSSVPASLRNGEANTETDSDTNPTDRALTRVFMFQ